ncbi:MAG: radical SAM protein [Oscillatoriales cyanobacterium SM2_2_1]|nr:radical SAM protein [Oscillatoriales cyanobacterium SM2_2_1]
MAPSVFAAEKILFERAQPSADALSFVFAFPNTYGVGITSLGYQTIWALLASRPDVAVSRWFTDIYEPLPRQIDLLGFSFSWELDYGQILGALEHFQLPIASRDRQESDPLVWGGGPVLTANPEPFAAWFDFILLGDGEDLIPAMVAALQEVRTAPRKQKLRRLAQVPGVYVPSGYGVTYGDPEGAIAQIHPIDSDFPPVVTKQTYRGNTLSASTVVTPHAAWENIYMVEVVRSCPELCRFCLASYLTLPFRAADVTTGLIPAIARGLAVTPRLGLLGASITQHPEFESLIDFLAQPAYDHVRLSLSSVRTNTLSRRLCNLLSQRDSRSVTIAVESGSDRLRQIINKKLTNDEIYQAAEHAQSGGLQALKLYGMVGVPQEEDADIEATIALLLHLKKTAPKLRLSFGCSTFVPKAHTPWQWYGVRPVAEKRLKLLQKHLVPKGIDFRPESYKDSLMQALLSRGDRRLEPLLRLAYSYAKAAGQATPSDGMVKRAAKELRDTVPPLSWYIHDDWAPEPPLPWQHLQGPLPLATLEKHRTLSLGVPL